MQDRAAALAAAGHHVTVLTSGLTRRNISRTDEISQYLTIRYLSSQSQRYSDQLASEQLAACLQINPDIVHSDSLDVNRPWWKELPHTIKTSITLHGFAWGALFTQFGLAIAGRGGSNNFDWDGFLKERETINSFNVVIGISRHEHWMLQSLFAITRAKLVYNPIANYFFDTPAKPVTPAASKRFMCAAISGQSYRGFDLAEKAAKLAGMELVTHSSTPREQMPAAYDDCCALVLPTLFQQGADLCVDEAQSRCRPVLASATGSYLREAEVNAGIHLFPPGDIEAIAKLMRQASQGKLAADAEQSEKHRPEQHIKNWLAAHDS